MNRPIVRIVKMVFREEDVETFQQLFAERKDRIRHFPGCRHLELWQDDKQKNIFFTYSNWDGEEWLDHYRFSEFFKETWSLTKALFADKPEAWTLNPLVIAPE
ncbi:MAG: antibiotic biosynthesis monooxygenase [Chitinophagaceae bacterium]|nr:antibiotic biosynthesis monooxygenase [Chitinophagaceae bacterium]